MKAAIELAGPPVTTWDGVRAHIRSHYLVAQEEPTWMELHWSFPRAEGRAELAYQKARVACGRAMGMDWLVVVAPVGPRTLIDPMTALELNGLLLDCSVACFEEHVVIRGALPLAALDVEMLRAILEAVPYEAARLRELGRPAAARPIFEEYGG